MVVPKSAGKRGVISPKAVSGQAQHMRQLVNWIGKRCAVREDRSQMLMPWDFALGIREVPPATELSGGRFGQLPMGNSPTSSGIDAFPEAAIEESATE